MPSHSLKLIHTTAVLSVSTQVEAACAKDRWDAHTIPGLRSAPHRSDYDIDFHLIPEIFRSTVKEFVTFKRAAGVATSTRIRCTSCLRNVLLFFSTLSPWEDT